MAAYLIGHITIKDNVKWEKYVEGVQQSLTPFGAKVVFRGRRVNVFAGEHPHHRTVVIQFSAPSVMQQWYGSENYQKLIPLRDEAADVVIIGYEA